MHRVSRPPLSSPLRARAGIRLRARADGSVQVYKKKVRPKRLAQLLWYGLLLFLLTVCGLYESTR